MDDFMTPHAITLLCQDTPYIRNKTKYLTQFLSLQALTLLKQTSLRRSCALSSRVPGIFGHTGKDL